MHAITKHVPVRLTPFSVFGLLLAVVGCGTIAVDIRTQIINQQEIRQEIEYVISGPIAELFITDGQIDLGEEASLGDLDAIEAAGWDLDMSVGEVDGEDALVMRLSQTFTGMDAADQFRRASEALAEEDTSTTMMPLLEITETDDEIIYEIRMSVSADEPTDSTNVGFDDSVPTVEPLVIDGTPFPGLPDFSGSGDFGDFGDLEGAFTDGLEDFSDALAESFEDFITVNWMVEIPGEVEDSNATSQDGRQLVWSLTLSDLSEEEDKELFARSVVNKNAGGSCNR